MIAEILGYIALGFLLYAYTHSNMTKLRIFGIVGSVVFTVQALMITQWSLVVANVIFAGIHIYHLYKINKEKGEVDGVPCER